MSILSDVDILRFCENKKITILDMSRECFRPSSYVLRLHNTLLVRDSHPTEIDTKLSNTAHLYEKILIPNEGFVLEPYKIYIAASFERVKIDHDICGDMGLLSCYARIGLNLNFGSNFVAATFGQNEPSRITFEIINLSQDRIRIYSGVKFCHLRFHLQSSSSEEKYNGIYAAGNDFIASNFCLKPAN